MRRLWVYLLLLAFASLAQEPITFGPRLGLDFSSFTGPDAHRISLPMGAMVGVYAFKEIHKHWSIQAEAVYVTAGSQYELRNDSLHRQHKLSLGYMTLPVLADYTLKSKWHLQLGGQAAFLLNAITDLTQNNKTTNRSTMDGYKAFDYGPLAGVMYQFPFGLNVGIRYFNSVTSFHVPSSGLIMYNAYAQFIIGYRFYYVKPTEDQNR